MSWNFHPLEIAVLKALFSRPAGEREDLLREAVRMDSGQFQMATGWLKAKNLVEETVLETRTEVSLTETGQKYVEDGFPEEWILRKLKEDPSLTLDALRKSVEDPAQISKAIGDLKEMGVLSILPGGRLEQGGPFPPSLERTYGIIRTLVENSPLTLEDLSPEDRDLLGSFQRKRGKGKGVLRFDVREIRRLSLKKGALSPEDLDVRNDLLGPVTSPTRKLDRTGFLCKERIIPAHPDIVSRVKLCSSLTYENISRQNLLAVMPFDAQSFRFAVASVPGGAHPFFMCHDAFSAFLVDNPL